MPHNVAVVLAAGQGTRMKSRLPKVLHKICGREMVRLVVEAARMSGFDTTVVVSRNSCGIRAVLGDSVQYSVQNEQLGTGHALLQATNLPDTVNNIIVLNGDVPLVNPTTLGSLMDAHLAQDAVATILTTELDDPNDLGRIIRNSSGAVTSVVEQEIADDATRTNREVNCGLYCFKTSWLWPTLRSLNPSASGELYLTDLVAAAVGQGRHVATVPAEHPDEVIGVNTRLDLYRAEAVMRWRILERTMLSGITMVDPSTTYIDHDATIGKDTTIYPNTHIVGPSKVGNDCEIGPNSIIDDSVIGDQSRIVSSVLRGAHLEQGVTVGPFSHLRPGTHLEDDVHIGSYAEIKASRLGQRTQSGHFSYIGDAHIGAGVNIGAGTITCNYDGIRKHSICIEDGAFIGSDSMLVAPIKIGARASTGAGAVVTKDVPPDTLVVGIPARTRSHSQSRDLDQGGGTA